MTLTQHVAVTSVAVAVLYPRHDGLSLLLFAVGSILIDIDHYLLYIHRTGRCDVSGMFRYFERLQPIEKSIPYVGLCVFHTIDFFLLIGILGYFNPPLRFLLAGFIFHFLLDVVDLRRKGVLFIRPFFLVEHAIRRRAAGYPWY